MQTRTLRSINLSSTKSLILFIIVAGTDNLNIFLITIWFFNNINLFITSKLSSFAAFKASSTL